MPGTEIIAFDYYDGPTEGLARTVTKVGPCYFKLIAWDDAQEQRLFVVVAIERSDFELGLAEMAAGPRPTDARVQVLSRNAGGNDEDDVLERLIKHCQEKVGDTGVLLLGPSVDAPAAVLIPIREPVRHRVVEALSAESPADLFDWLPRLEQSGLS